MTTDDLLKLILRNGMAIVTTKEYREIFPGRKLSEVELEFKIEMEKQGQGLFNPRGSSQFDQLLSFCSKNGLCQQPFRRCVLFMPGQRIPDPLPDVVMNAIKAVQAGAKTH